LSRVGAGAVYSTSTVSAVAGMQLTADSRPLIDRKPIRGQQPVSETYRDRKNCAYYRRWIGSECTASMRIGRFGSVAEISVHKPDNNGRGVKIGLARNFTAESTQRRLRTRRFKLVRTFTSFKSISDVFTGLNDWNIWNDWNAVGHCLCLGGQYSFRCKPEGR